MDTQKVLYGLSLLTIAFTLSPIVHVTHEDFELAVAKVMKRAEDQSMSVHKLFK